MTEIQICYGYHKANIERGEYGEISKIKEELLELIDAQQQGNRIMELIELADLVGAINGYLEKYHASYTIKDLLIMAEATERAFRNGERD